MALRGTFPAGRERTCSAFQTRENQSVIRRISVARKLRYCLPEREILLESRNSTGRERSREGTTQFRLIGRQLSPHGQYCKQEWVLVIASDHSTVVERALSSTSLRPISIFRIASFLVYCMWLEILNLLQPAARWWFCSLTGDQVWIFVLSISMIYNRLFCSHASSYYCFLSTTVLLILILNCSKI